MRAIFYSYDFYLNNVAQSHTDFFDWAYNNGFVLFIQ